MADGLQDTPRMTRDRARLLPWMIRLVLLLAVLSSFRVVPAEAGPGLCIGPVCGDEITRNPTLPWQLRLRVWDQRGRHERVVVDCRDGLISPRIGPVERGYAAALARRACRLAGSEADGLSASRHRDRRQAQALPRAALENGPSLLRAP